MLLDALSIDEMREDTAVSRPLIVTKDSPRKAYFRRMNLDKKGAKKMRRFRDSGITKRGNIWAGNPHGQRVVVKINVVKNKDRKITSSLNGGRVSYGGSGANLSAHISYISRSGAGEEGEKAILFDKENEGIDASGFFERSRDDRHHFRMIISPENGHDIGDFREYVRDVMSRAEKDLGSDLDWVSAVHYDTDDIHAHVIIRGVNARGQDLVIARDYIAFGFRSRAQERATELMGERSIDEIQKSIEKEIDALRVTSLDRFIEENMDESRVIDVRKENNFGKSQHYEQMIKGRLRYLESTGLATQHPPGVFTLEEGYRDTLYAIGQKDDVLKKLYGRFEGKALEDISIYSMKAGEGQVIEGFAREKGFVDEITDRKYLVVEDMRHDLHYVPAGENIRLEDIEAGSLIRIRPGDRSSGKADYNIDLMAGKNNGIYDYNKHMAYIEKEMDFIEPENRQGYLDSHLKRLETLEQNGVVERIEEGIYKVPENVIARGEEITRQINERENKRFYPMIDLLSKEPLEELVRLEKKTWLDKELYKQFQGKPSLSSYDETIKQALEHRKDWLVERDLGLIQSNGEFALRSGALSGLNNMELKHAGDVIAKDYGVAFETNMVKENTQYRYLGFVKLESGYWAAIGSQQNTLQLAKLSQKPEIKKNAYVEFDALEKGVFAMREVERQRQTQKQISRDNERGDELER